MAFLILRWHLDLVGFVGAMLAAGAALDWWLRRSTRGGLGWLVRTALLVVIGVGAASAISAGNEVDRHLKQMIGGFAPTYAEETARLGQARVTLDTSPDDPTYLQLIDAQRRWLRINPFAADIYTFGRRADGQICLLVDSETDYDGNGRIEGDKEQRTPIGEPYDRDADRIGRAFAGESNFMTRPTIDRWGTWMSAYVPVRAQGDAGPVVAVLGIDYPADKWLQSILVHRAAMLGLAGTIAAVIAGAAATNRMARAAAASREMFHWRAANHDGLTGLPNRALLHRRLADAADRRPSEDSCSALLFLDFDGFKDVNDTLGHAAGDELLREIAGRIEFCLRSFDGPTFAEADPSRAGAASVGFSPAAERGAAGAQDDSGGATAARLGGDEFCVFLPVVRGIEQPEALAEQLVATFRRPHRIAGRSVTATVSIGLAHAGAGTMAPDAMLRNADAAMYRSKHAGGDRWTAAGPTGLQMGQCFLRTSRTRPAEIDGMRRLAS